MWVFDAPVKKAKETVLLYSAPRKETEEQAEQHITNLCRRRLEELYGDNQKALSLLMQELEVIRERKLFFEMWMMAEIAKFSLELCFPVIPEGTLAFSLVSYLLGITMVDPLHTGGLALPFEMMWTYPCIQLVAAPTVRGRLAERLQSIFGRLRGSTFHFDRVVLTNDMFKPYCETIGRLAAKYQYIPKMSDFDEAVYQRAASRMIDEKVRELDDPDGSYARELRKAQVSTLRELIRFFPFINSYPELGKSPERLNDSHFLVLREEIFTELKAHGVTAEDAVWMLSRGMLTDESINEVVNKLAPYNLPEYVTEAIRQGYRTWDADCFCYMQNACIMAWYELNGDR